MARVVLDANVVVSAAFGGFPLKAVRRAFQHEVIISPVIREELLQLSAELSGKLSPDRVRRVRRMMKILLLKSTMVRLDREVHVCRDPKDDAYLSICLTAHAGVLVTGDLDLLSIPKAQLEKTGLAQLKILTPRRFLAIRVL